MQKCKSKRSLTLYLEEKDKISNQQKLVYEKNRNKLMQKRNEKYIHFKGVLRNYIELENRYKAMEGNVNNK